MKEYQFNEVINWNGFKGFYDSSCRFVDSVFVFKSAYNEFLEEMRSK